MTDDEYIEFLEAVAAEYVRLSWDSDVAGPNSYGLQNELRKLSEAGAIARLAADTQENERLSAALREALVRASFEFVSSTLDQSGVLEAMDSYAEPLIKYFRPSVLPFQDLEILHRAGIENPAAALRLAQQRAPHFARLAEGRDFLPSAVLAQAAQQLGRVEQSLKGSQSSSNRKPRKWFKGITRILAGGAGAAGNVMLGAGLIPVAAPVGAAAVLGSCTGALVLIGDGIEALRGVE